MNGHLIVSISPAGGWIGSLSREPDELPEDRAAWPFITVHNHGSEPHGQWRNEMSHRRLYGKAGPSRCRMGS